jgi:hypothetical protein
VEYDYEGSVDFLGDACRALECAKDLLVSNGMKVRPVTANQLYFENPASRFKMEGQKPSLLTKCAMHARNELARDAKHQILLMVSKGVVTATGSALTMQAELSNAQVVVRFIIRLTVLGIVATVLMAIGWILWIYGLPVVAFSIALIFLPNKQRGVSDELDALLAEAAGTGEPKA